MNPRASFTLIEILVTIAIVAIVSVVIVLTLNPAQLLKQTRDSNRLSDLQTLNKAISLFETDQPGGSLGNASTTYFSIIDPTATTTAGTLCEGTGLPSPPLGWTYRCAASSTLRNTDGTGWVPVNFDQMNFRAIASIPVDPINSTSSGLYYTYTPHASWELVALLESSKRQSMMSQDGGDYDGLYQVGTSLNRTPSTRSAGLVGYWTFDEGSGTVARDASGSGNNGTLTNGPTWQTGANCRIGSCLSFNGSTQYINLSSRPASTLGPISVAVWVYGNELKEAVMRSAVGDQAGDWILGTGSDGSFMWYNWQGNGERPNDRHNSATGLLTSDAWHHIAVTWNGSTNKLYLNGSQVAVASTGSTSLWAQTAHQIGRTWHTEPFNWNGKIDDVRVYNRALSAAEIQAIYNTSN
jgi:type II secretory pathway pseudopilin PulG